MLLADKRILVTGVLNDASIAFSRRAARAGGGRRGRAHVVRPGDEPHAARRAAAPDRARRSSSSTSPTPADLDALAERVGGHLDGVLHAIGFAPESCLGGGFLDRAVGRRRGRAAGVGVLAEGAGGRVPAADGERRRASSASTSTTAASPGRSTTGWAWRRPRSSRPRATSPATSARRASASTSSRPGRSARSRRAASPASSSSRTCGTSARPLGWDVKDPAPVAARVRRAALRPVPRHHRRDHPRRRRLPRHRRLTASSQRWRVKTVSRWYLRPNCSDRPAHSACVENGCEGLPRGCQFGCGGARVRPSSSAIATATRRFSSDARVASAA